MAVFYCSKMPTIQCTHTKNYIQHATINTQYRANEDNCHCYIGCLSATNFPRKTFSKTCPHTSSLIRFCLSVCLSVYCPKPWQPYCYSSVLSTDLLALLTVLVPGFGLTKIYKLIYRVYPMIARASALTAVLF